MGHTGIEMLDRHYVMWMGIENRVILGKGAV
jgi:hypothetical protein